VFTVHPEAVLSCAAGCPACRIADGPSARRVKKEALPCSPRAWFSSSPRRLGSLRYHNNPVTDSLWMHLRVHGKALFR